MFITFLICALLSVAPLHNQYNVEDYTENNVVEKLERKNIVYDKSNYNVYYDNDDLNDYDLMYSIYTLLYDNGYDSQNKLVVDGLFTTTGSDRSFGNMYYDTTSYWDSENQQSVSIPAIKFYDGMTSLGFITDNNTVIVPSGSFGIALTMSITSEDYFNLVYEPTTGDRISVPMGEFVTILTAPIVGVANGVATGVSHMAESLFLASNQGTITGLSTFGGIMALFCGLGLAIHLTTRVYLWITSLGKD